MNKIVINGVTIATGGTITVINGRVTVDGKDVTPESREINISVVGNVEHLEVDVCQKISITGDAGNISTQSGAVQVSGNIRGSVQTMSGRVDCDGSIGGSVSTMSGSIRSRS